MNSKQRRTLRAIFTDPVSPAIRWKDIESLFKALGATIREGEGSRVHVAVNGKPGTFHRPHPGPAADKGAVKSVRRLLENAGISLEDKNDGHAPSR